MSRGRGCSWLLGVVVAAAAVDGTVDRGNAAFSANGNISALNKVHYLMQMRGGFSNPPTKTADPASSAAADRLTEHLVRLSNLPMEVAGQCRAQWYNVVPVDSVVPGVGRGACCSDCLPGVTNARLSDAQREDLNLSWRVPGGYRHHVGNVWRLGPPHLRRGTEENQNAGSNAGTDGANELHLLCTKKTGVTLWTRFLFKVFTSSGKVQPKWLGDKQHPEGNQVVSSRIPPGAQAVLVTRNPYTRFLSAILDKGPPPELLDAINVEMQSHGFKIFEPNPNRKKKSVDKHSRPWSRVITPATFRLMVHVLYRRYLDHDQSWGFPSHETKLRVLRSTLIDNPHFWPQTAILLQFKYQCHRPPPAASFITVKVEEEPSWFLCLMRAAGLRLEDVSTGFQGVRHHDQSVSPWKDEDCFWHPKGKGCSWLAENWDTPGAHAAGRDEGEQASVATPTGESDQHNHGAGKLANRFYDKMSAARIREIFQGDFDLLGYPMWDGGGPTTG